MLTLIEHESILKKVFFYLLILTALTLAQPVAVPMELAGTLWVQMLIALTKVYLVVMFYMHLKYETPLFKAVLWVAIITLGIFFVITASDAIFREMPNDLFRGGV